MREHNTLEMKTNAIECPDCGSTGVETRHLRDRFSYGTGPNAVELEAVVPYHKCLDCKFEFTGAGAEDSRHEAICRHLGLMPPSEVVGVRQRYRMTRAVFAEKTRIGEASLARWETGLLIQNAANDNYLYLLCFPDNMQRLESRYSFEKSSNALVPAGVQSRRFRELESSDISAKRRESRNFLNSFRREAA
jgi:DNA-binding transcriptional regulator YiaG